MNTQAVMGVLQAIQLAVTIALAVLGYRLSVSQQAFSEKIADIETNLKLSQEKRAAAEGAEKLRFQLFEQVSRSLEKKEHLDRHLLATNALIVSLLQVDDPLRIGLLEALKVQASNGEATRGTAQKLEQVAAQERDYQAGQESIETAVADLRQAFPDGSRAGLKGYLVDVFYCEGGDRSRAEKLAQALDSQKIRSRLRMLAASVNAGPGFRVQGLQLRYNGDELPVAQELRKVIAGQQQGDFSLRQVTNSTPNYLSTFICS